MRSKCLWKMMISSDNVYAKGAAVDPDAVIECVHTAIERLPERRDSRVEPIFEPHTRLVSIVHKMVLKGLMQVCTLKDDGSSKLIQI